MSERNDDITSPPLRHGILSSALADLHKCDSNIDGTSSIAGFRSKSILVDKATRQGTPRLTSAVYNSPLSTYRGILGTALRNENLISENNYLPSQCEQQLTSIGTSLKSLPTERSLSKDTISLNDRKFLTTPLDINCSTLQSAQCIGAGKGKKSEWFQDTAESTSDLSGKKGIADKLFSPHTGMLGLLLKKETEFQYAQDDKSTNSLSSSLDLITNETARESRILTLENQERSDDKHLSLGGLRSTSFTPSETSSQSMLSKIDGSREDHKEDLIKSSIQYDTSKEPKSSNTPIGLLIDKDECEGKSISSKVCLKAKFF